MSDTDPIATSATANERATDGAAARFVRTFVRFGRPLLILVPILYVVAFLPRAGALDEGDAANAYYRAGEMIRAGRSMYEPLPPTGVHRLGLGAFYLYPPPLGALSGLLPRAEPGTFQTIVLIANVLAIWVFAWALGRLAGLRGRWAAPAIALGLMLMPGLMETIAIGNIDPIVFALVALGLTVPAAAGTAALAAGAALKVTPVWAVGVLLARGGRRAWYGAAAVAVACILIVIGAVGFHGLVSESMLWAQRIAPTLSQGQFDVLPIMVGDVQRSGWMVNGNISPAFVPVRLLVEPPPPNVDLPLAARLYLSIVQFGVPALTVFLTRRRPPVEQAAWVITAATLAAPIMRGGYLPVLLILPAILVGRSRSPRTAPAPPPEPASASASAPFP